MSSNHCAKGRAGCLVQGRDTSAVWMDAERFPHARLAESCKFIFTAVVFGEALTLRDSTVVYSQIMCSPRPIYPLKMPRSIKDDFQFMVMASRERWLASPSHSS